MSDYQIAEPAFEIDKYWFTITFTRNVKAPHDTPHDTPQVLKLLTVLEGEMDRNTIQKRLGLKDRFHFRDAYVQPALQAVFIEMTIPAKPTSKNQKYRLTRIGLEYLARKDKK